MCAYSFFTSFLYMPVCDLKFVVNRLITIHKPIAFVLQYAEHGTVGNVDVFILSNEPYPRIIIQKPKVDGAVMTREIIYVDRLEFLP